MSAHWADKARTCPNCYQAHPCATGLNGGKVPTTGAVMVCLNCATVCSLDERLEMVPFDVETMRHDPESYALVKNAVREIRKLRGIK